MNKEHCCGAQQVFDENEALKKRKRLKKKGAVGPTKKLIETLVSQGVSEQSLLDIGGGIGTIQFQLLENGVSNVTSADASTAYLKVSGEEAETRGFSSRITYLEGDFTEIAEEIGKHDVVTLDKVICCYPDMTNLLGEALKRTNDRIGLVYPVGGFISKLLMGMASLMMRLKNNPFRAYAHSPKEVHDLITSSGFHSVYEGRSFPWRVEVYQRRA